MYMVRLNDTLMRTRCFLVIVGVALCVMSMPLIVQAQSTNEGEVVDVFIEDFTDEQLEAFNTAFTEAFGTQVTEGEPTGNVSCFDYYRFNSVQVAMQPTLESTVPGTPVTVSGTITNENPYPVVSGTLYVKIFRARDTTEKHVNGLPVVDQFVAVSSINLEANGTKEFSFDWNVPAWAKPGTYQIATFFVSKGRYNLLGLSFTDDVVGNTTSFEVIADETGIVEFDKDTVRVAGMPYFFAAFPPRVAQGEPVELTAEIVNTTDEDKMIAVVANVYAWDAMEPNTNLVDRVTQKVLVPAQDRVPVSFTVTDTTQPVYLAELSLQYADTKSVLNVRFARDGISKLRLNFPATATYPLKAGEDATIFACFHNVADMTEQGTLRLSVLDELGQEVHTYEYSGPVSGLMSGVADVFTPKKTLTSFSVRAELFQNGTLVDEARMWYSCEDLNACDFEDGRQGTFINYLMSIGGLLVALLIALWFKKSLTRKGVVIG